MAFWDFGRRTKNYESLDSLNQLNVKEEIATAGVKYFVIAASLTKPSDCLRVAQEVEKGNILLLDTREFPGDKGELDLTLLQLKNTLEQKGGEMAKISNERILVTPAHFKIVKKNL